MHKTEQKQKDLDQEDQQILNRKSQRKPHTGVTAKLLKITEKENLESRQMTHGNNNRMNAGFSSSNKGQKIVTWHILSAEKEDRHTAYILYP